MNKSSNETKKLWDLIKNIQVAMLTTQDGDGTLRSRPMAMQQTDFDGELWFFTDSSSHKVDEIHTHHLVNVSMVDTGKNRYVSISGRAQIVRDRARARQMWKPFLRAWFPKGADDPEVSLLKVKVETAEFWDSPASKVVQMAGFLKAIAIGEAKTTTSPEHQKITLKD